ARPKSHQATTAWDFIACGTDCLASRACPPALICLAGHTTMLKDQLLCIFTHADDPARSGSAKRDHGLGGREEGRGFVQGLLRHSLQPRDRERLAKRRDEEPADGT